MEKNNQAAQEWVDLFEKIKKIPKKVASDYAYKNHKEMFAEMFAYMVYPAQSHILYQETYWKYFFNTYLNTKFIEQSLKSYKPLFQEFNAQFSKRNITK